ncbi:uncharacterized protein si:ch211-217g15.3 [Kryptolebias marmoratus]|uniref:uncharacterized protein si:ch211-217g15.3 n=1 Tax=Kryptolebias marmoratus TaxID=37003 RepID=UPI0007F87F4A|nr:uncharacterized protein si:ch211-217g15.3 [Kryptolebias marmoratus]
MFRVSVIVSVLLIVGITAKPWNKHENGDVKEAVVSIDEEGRLSWQVEPPEDRQDINYDIDRRMRIWKSMKVPKAEEDMDELYHPSTDELHLQSQKDPAADVPLKRYVSIEYKQEAEEDRDVIDHPVFAEVIAEENQAYDKEDPEAREKVVRYLAPLMAGYKPEVGDAPYQPETNEDQVSSVEVKSVSSKEGRIHLQPEEDMDDLYHKDILMPVSYQDHAKDAAPDYLLPQRNYSEPEVDLDDLYHK